MNTDAIAIVEFIKNVTFEEVKDLPATDGRAYLNEELETEDEELDGSSHHLYLTIFQKPNANGEDRYFGSNTKSDTQSFMGTDYVGTPISKAIDFANSKGPGNNFRTICLAVGRDDGDILTEEQNVLTTVDAKNNFRFFNDSNTSGGKAKTRTKQIQLFKDITEMIEKANDPLASCKYVTGWKDVVELHDMPRAQPRDHDFNEKHANDIEKDIVASISNINYIVNTIRHTILLEDYFGPGKHMRGGNTHTIAALSRPRLKEIVKQIRYIMISKKVWKACSKNTLRDILRWDNKGSESISRIPTSSDEILDSCYDFMIEHDISNHTDVRVKERALDLGMLPGAWNGSNGIRSKLKIKISQHNSETDLPSGHELIVYKESDLKDIEDSESSDNHVVKCLSTVYSGGVFNGWDWLVTWLTDGKNKNKTLHIKFYHGKDSYKKHADIWQSVKCNDIIPRMEKLFSRSGGSFTFDYLDRYQKKQNPI